MVIRWLIWDLSVPVKQYHKMPFCLHPLYIFDQNNFNSNISTVIVRAKSVGGPTLYPILLYPNKVVVKIFVGTRAATGLLETVLLCNWVRSTRRLALRLYIEAIRLGNISLLKSMSKKMMLLAKVHAFKATKSAGALATWASFFF